MTYKVHALVDNMSMQFAFVKVYALQQTSFAGFNTIILFIEQINPKQPQNRYIPRNLLWILIKMGKNPCSLPKNALLLANAKKL
ncbi:hypothetical protein GJ496_003410 [Pomphorhynchus laevis]|nr:hypothetical protein GJ496_003410 [Pomphorhynchus laevis]